MHVSRRSLRMLAGAVAALGAVAVAAASTATAGTTRAAANPFAHYGNITLKVRSADNQDPGPRARDQGAVEAVHEAKYPNVKVKLTFKGFTDYMKVIQLALERQLGAGRRRGQPGLRHRRAAGQGQADPAARQVRQAVRLEQALPPGEDAAVPLDARRQDVRRGHALGRRPVRPVDRRLLQQGQAQAVRRRPGQAADDLRGVRQAARHSCAPRCRRAIR